MPKPKSTEKKKPGASIAPGSNWLALKKKLPTTSKGSSISRQPAKTQPSPSSASFPRGSVPTNPIPDVVTGSSKIFSEEVKSLQDLVLGKGVAGEDLVGEPGRYIAIDCEMVGVGENGSESSLARASIVDFQGRVVLDEFVLQRERVTDYRTQVSGVRPKDMINAKPFSEVQARIATLLSSADRILVGHALHNDLTALLLSHPAARIRDTQVYAGRKPNPGKGKGKGKEGEGEKTLWEKYRSPRIGLKRLVKEELGLDIQAGEHSSVTDARAAMAIYQLHKRAWDASLPVSYVKRGRTTSGNEAESGSLATGEDMDQAQEGSAKRKRRDSAGEFPGGGRKGVSSGLGTIIKPRARKTGKERVERGSADQAGSKWWQTLGAGQSKGKLTL
ncbi:exonuclease domain protein [Rhizoctonia solani]|uniref:RNA exonuclease 4 n=1 Tax=Rhizoctonia solani TaxID=456999 RepID=A0A8H8P6D9_9AGAM|nr:exonuclease domain protein [Rhizoctonia solani]QRW25548.1 exonuclease domain protein [Rhizoctonia solani]